MHKYRRAFSLRSRGSCWGSCDQGTGMGRALHKEGMAGFSSGRRSWAPTGAYWRIVIPFWNSGIKADQEREQYGKHNGESRGSRKNKGSGGQRFFPVCRENNDATASQNLSFRWLPFLFLLLYIARRIEISTATEHHGFRNIKTFRLFAITEWLCGAAGRQNRPTGSPGSPTGHGTAQRYPSLSGQTAQDAQTVGSIRRSSALGRGPAEKPRSPQPLRSPAIPPVLFPAEPRGTGRSSFLIRPGVPLRAPDTCPRQKRSA